MDKEYKLPHIEDYSPEVGRQPEIRHRGFLGFPKLKQWQVGAGNRSIHADIGQGLWLGHEQFDRATFRVDMDGIVYAKRLTLENFVNDNDPSITYTGIWVREAVGVLYGRSRTVSNTVGNHFEISFIGTSIGLILERTGNQGQLEISIDGIVITTIDLFSTALFSRSVVWQRTNLENRAHILRGTVRMRNVSATDNRIGLQGYTLFPHEGIKMEQLSCDLYSFFGNLTTDANGYVKTVPSVPSGYSVYCIVGVSLSESVMSDTILTDPKIAWKTTSIFLYNGAANTTYAVAVTLLLSKL